MRIVGDVVAEEHPIRKSEGQPAAEPTPARVVEAQPAMRQLPSDPMPATLVTSDGRTLDVRGRLRRLPAAFDAWVNGWFDIQPRGIFLARLPESRALASVTAQRQIIVNVSRVSPWCPVMLLGHVAHEAEHIRLEHPAGQDAAHEREAEDAAEAVIVGLVESVESKQPAAGGQRLDAAKCVACYQNPGGDCRQSESGQGRVFDVLSKYTGLDAGTE